MHTTSYDERRAILVSRHAAGGFNPPAPSYKAEVLHTLASALALGLFVVGGLLFLVGVTS